MISTSTYGVLPTRMDTFLGHKLFLIYSKHNWGEIQESVTMQGYYENAIKRYFKYKHNHITKTAKVTILGVFTQLFNTLCSEKINTLFFSQLLTSQHLLPSLEFSNCGLRYLWLISRITWQALLNNSATATNIWLFFKQKDWSIVSNQCNSRSWSYLKSILFFYSSSNVEKKNVWGIKIKNPLKRWRFMSYTWIHSKLYGPSSDLQIYIWLASERVKVITKEPRKGNLEKSTGALFHIPLQK